MEGKATRQFCRTLEAQGAMTYPLVGSRYAPPGWPDRYVGHANFKGFLEFKSSKRGLKKAQPRVLQQMELRGIEHYVLRFSEDEELIQVEDRHGVILLGYARWSTVSEWLLRIGHKI